MSEQSEASEKSYVLLGMALMVVAMLTIPIVDGLAKYLSQSHSPLYVSFARYAVAAMIILPMSTAIHGRRILPSRDFKTHFLRTVLLVCAMTCYFIAISKVELATAVTAFFVSPIIATILAVFILGESLTWRKGLSLLLGLCGTIIILQPGGDIDPAIFLALAAGGFFAAYMIATRLAAQKSDPIRTLTFQCLVGALLLFPQALWTWSWPTADEWPFFLALGAASVASHLLSIAAFRYAQASILAPLLYVELIGTVIVGYYAFGEVPVLFVWFGALFIIAGGLLLIQRRQ